MFKNWSFSVVNALRSWLSYLYSSKTKRNSFQDRKKTISFSELIRLRFQGYHCESGLVICAWKLAWNYAYSSFKLFLLLRLLFGIGGLLFGGYVCNDMNCIIFAGTTALLCLVCIVLLVLALRARQVSIFQGGVG